MHLNNTSQNETNLRTTHGNFLIRRNSNNFRSMQSSRRTLCHRSTTKRKSKHCTVLKHRSPKIHKRRLRKNRIEMQNSTQKQLKLKFQIYNNFFAEMGNGDSTYCFCIGSFVEGMYEKIMHTTPKIQKTRCIGQGDRYCEWHISPK